MRLKRRPRFLSGTELTVNVVCLLVDTPRDHKCAKKRGLVQKQLDRILLCFALAAS
jgi:hypothetical protein